eukprot:CFRG2145T1
MSELSKPNDEIIQHLVKTYTDVAGRREIADVLYVPTHSTHGAVSVHRTQKDLYNSTTRKFETTYIKTDVLGITGFEVVGLPMEVNENVVLSAYSPTGQKKATFSCLDKDKVTYRLDVWGYDELLTTITVDSDLHGPIYTDALFKTFEFNANEDKIMYIAERKRVKTQGYWAKNKAKPGNDTPPVHVGGEYEYQEDWGELFVDRIMSDIFIVDLKTRDVAALSTELDNVALCGAVWAPDGNSIVSSGFHIPQGQRLGLVYCFNRPCDLYKIAYKGDGNAHVRPVCLTAPDQFFHSRSPRFNRDGTKVAFLNTPETKTHNSASSLFVMNWPNHAEVKEVVPITRRVAGPGCCYGIYALGLAGRCWSEDGDYVYFSTYWRSDQAICQADISNGKISRVSPENGSFELLDIKDDMLLAKVSTPASPPEVINRDMRLTNSNTEWETITGSPKTEDMDWGVLSVDVAAAEPIEVIYCIPKSPLKKPMPLAVFAHGGPHGSFLSDWKTSVSFLVRLGYAVCQINYRGSTGFGVDALESVLGKIGTQDVKDCQLAVEKVLCTYPNISKDHVVYCGGSHGGFLGAHLIAKYPGFYKAAVLQNPVINLVEEASTGDIPDWVYAESGLSTKPWLNEEDMQILYENSPIANDLSVINTPTLFMLGAMDRRVPPSQGLQFYHALNSLGVETKVYWFPTQSHPIDEIGCSADLWINSALWYNRFVSATE